MKDGDAKTKWMTRQKIRISRRTFCDASMKGYNVALLLVLLLAVVFPAEGGAAPLSADEVAYNVYHRDVGRDMQMRGTMLLISAGGQKRQREYISMRLDSEADRRVIIRFTAPADIAGTGFLVREIKSSGETEQHLYLPALKRVRRIVASQQGRKFVNSDFTYEDMHRHPLSAWTYTLAEEVTVLGRACYQLISTPLPTTVSQYSSIISLIDMKTFMPLKSDFYDKDKRHCKTYVVNKIAVIDGIATELDVVMRDNLSQHSTVLHTNALAYNRNLKKSLFSVHALEK